MQSDEVIWQIINHQFCSYKSKVAEERTFCQNPYNVSGLCLRSACPLANSSYATIREEEGTCFLFIKTAERAHTPKYLWEKIALPSNYTKALEIVSTHLEHFPKYLVHRNKQRLTKIHQMLIRMRKLKLKAKPKIVTTNTKVEQREAGRERKALKAAQLDRAIEKELLERLKQVSEGEIYNYPERQYQRALASASSGFKSKNVADPDEIAEDESEYPETELTHEEEYEDDEEEPGEYDVEYVENFEESDEEGDEADEGDIEDSAKRMFSSYYSAKGGAKGAASAAAKKRKSDTAPKKSTTKKSRDNQRARVEIEYEDEAEVPERAKVASSSSSNMDYNF